MNQKIIDVVLSIVAAFIAVLLSWPFWRDFEYWAESQFMWKVYIAVGFIVATYVFFIFLHCMHTLFDHDRLIKETSNKGGQS